VILVGGDGGSAKISFFVSCIFDAEHLTRVDGRTVYFLVSGERTRKYEQKRSTRKKTSNNKVPS
jgi:hypothetical protein